MSSKGEKKDKETAAVEYDPYKEVKAKGAEFNLSNLVFQYSLNREDHALQAKILEQVDKYNMGPYYQYLVDRFHWTVDAGRVKNFAETNKKAVDELQAALDDAVENLGEGEQHDAAVKLAEHFATIGDKAKILYAAGSNVTDNQEAITYLNKMDDQIHIDGRPEQDMIDEAVKVAQQSDVVVAVVGESRNMSHEAASRVDLVLPGRQRDLIKALKATGKPLVIVLMNGRPLALGEENKLADAMVESWFLGTEGGNALADVLFGDYNPSGKLPMTFPRSVGQVPAYYNHLNTGRPYRENDSNYTSNYFEEPTSPLFPFGYGLSYTQFSVSDIVLSIKQMTRKDKLTATVQVKNIGKVAGETVVQLYLRDIAASISRPVKELKNFQKIMLKPGEEKSVSFTVTEQDLKFFNPSLQFAAEAGEFKLMIGLDSEDVKETTFNLL